MDRQRLKANRLDESSLPPAHAVPLPGALALPRAERDVSVHPTTLLPGTVQIELDFAERLRSGQDFAACYADLDHFKEFNDTHGHQAGDEVLREIADAIKDAVHGVGFPARYGGEEFGVIMLCDAPEETKALAEEVRSAIECRHVPWNGAILHVTASVGYATAAPADTLMRCDQLVSQADECLYEAKRAGRNQVRPLAA